MITSFKHKGLKKLFETGRPFGVNPQHAERLRKILALLETAENIDDMDLPGLNLHKLKGRRKNTLTLQKSRMPQILGVEGEAVVLYREPSTTQ